MFRKSGLALVAIAISAAMAMNLLPFSGIHELAHESTQFHLHLIGSSIYQYHSTTGRWPTAIADLAKTSLPQQSRHWQQMFDDEVFVIVWHKALKPNPRDNAGEVLVYHDKGLIAAMGRSWVCWGDLRTEYIATEDLRTYLQNRPAVR